jgi:hypothetical protein
MSDDNDTRKQLEEDLTEDLELQGEDADAVRGGEGTLIPGNSKWEPNVLKKV